MLPNSQTWAQVNLPLQKAGKPYRVVVAGASNSGIVREPHGAWVEQKARDWTDPFDGFLREKQFLIVDRER